MTGCAFHDDGRHRYRWAPPSHWSAEPRYVCGPSCGIVLASGDGLVEDAAYVSGLGGVVAITCAACDVWGEVATWSSDDPGTIVVLDDVGGGTAVCRSCADDPGLARTLVERYGVRCDGCGDVCADDEADRYLTPVGEVELCHCCGPDDADTRADLAAMRAEVIA